MNISLPTSGLCLRGYRFPVCMRDSEGYERSELINLEQGEMSVIEYEQKFLNLLAFPGRIQLLEEVKAKMNQAYLDPRYKGMVKFIG